MLIRTLAALGVLTAMSGAALAQPAETTVTFTVDGGTVVGTLAVPEGPPAPVVVLFHGFGGSRHELEVPALEKGLYAYAAEKLAEAGYASLRIDFRGSGESDGEFEDTTYEAQIADGLAALAYLDTEPLVDADKLALIGWSQGGLVASAIAGRSGIPDAVALWAPLGEPELTFTNLLGAEAIQGGLKTGDTPYEMPMPWGFSLFTKQPYFEGIVTMNPLEEIAAYSGALLVAEGTEDEVIPAGVAEKFAAAHEGEEEVFVRPMNHSFNVFAEMATFDEMLDATIAFFGEHIAQ